MYFHIVGGTESYTTSTTNMYNKCRFHVRGARQGQGHGGNVLNAVEFVEEAFRGVVTDHFHRQHPSVAPVLLKGLPVLRVPRDRQLLRAYPYLHQFRKKRVSKG